jgi:uncharacterized membrane protein
MGGRTLTLTRRADGSPREDAGQTTSSPPETEAPTSERSAGIGAYLSRHSLDRTIAVALTLILFWASWKRDATFRSSTYDLAVFEQVVWKMAHGHGATSSLTAWNTFADHLSPVLLFFVPLYRLAATPLWFFGAQAIACGVGVLCVRPLVETVGLKFESGAATFIVAGFALHPAVWNAALYDFHPTTLAIPVLLIGCHAALRHRHLHVLLVLVALVVLRDDLALAGAAVACIGWRTDDRGGRMRRALIVASALAWTIAGAQVGAAMGASRHFQARYGYLGESMTDAALHPAHSVIGVLRHVFIADNVFFAVALLLPFAFLALRRPAWTAAALFVALPALAANDANFHSPKFHYGAPVVPFVVLAAAGGLHVLGSRWDRRKLAFIAAPLTAMAYFMAGPAATQALTEPTIDARDARAAIATLRPTDRVVAGTAIGPHVADRVELLPFPYPFTPANLKFPLDDRVTSTAATVQHNIDVVIASNLGWASQDLIDRVAAVPEIHDHFVRTDFGTVTVFRRQT